MLEAFYDFFLLVLVDDGCRRESKDLQVCRWCCWWNNWREQRERCWKWCKMSSWCFAFSEGIEMQIFDMNNKHQLVFFRFDYIFLWTFYWMFGHAFFQLRLFSGVGIELSILTYSLSCISLLRLKVALHSYRFAA